MQNLKSLTKLVMIPIMASGISSGINAQKIETIQTEKKDSAIVLKAGETTIEYFPKLDSGSFKIHNYNPEGKPSKTVNYSFNIKNNPAYEEQNDGRLLEVYLHSDETTGYDKNGNLSNLTTIQYEKEVNPKNTMDNINKYTSKQITRDDLKRISKIEKIERTPEIFHGRKLDNMIEEKETIKLDYVGKDTIPVRKWYDTDNDQKWDKVETYNTKGNISSTEVFESKDNE